MAIERPVAELLRASVAREGHGAAADLLAELDDDGQAALLLGARFHGISGYVHALAIDAPNAPADLTAVLTAFRQRNVFDHLRTTADLRALATTLDGAAVPWLVVKGPTLAEPFHGGVELRSYSDLDALVPGRHLGEAMAALERAGAQVIDRNWTLIRDQMKGEVHLVLPSGTALDLHWHVLNDRAVRDAFSVRLDDLFEARRSLPIAGIDVPTLSAAHTLVYIAMHTVLSGAHRLIWLKDLERLLERDHAELEAVVHTAQRWGAVPLLRAALDRTERAIGLPASGRELCSALPTTPLWSAVTRTAWRCAPAQRQDGSGSVARMVARSTRPTGGASTRTLARKLREHARHRRVDIDRDDAGRRTANDPGSGRYAAGGDEERRRYLADVARHANR